MPIWFELIVLLLAAYVIGLAIGWALWGRAATNELSENIPNLDTEEETL